MRILAIGRSQLLYGTVAFLRSKGKDIVGIVTGTESPEHTKTAADLKKLAKQTDCGFLFTDKIKKSEINWIRARAADAALSVNWKTALPPEVLNIFSLGIINFHIGDLPRYRGNATPNWAILNGEKEIVFTIHLMSPQLDAGNILTKERHKIGEGCYISDIYALAEERCPVLFLDSLKKLEKGHHGTVQSKRPSDIMRCLPRRPEDSQINWSRPALEIERLVRASSRPFCGAYTFLDSKKLIIWKARREPSKITYLGMPGQVVERRLKDRGEVSVFTGDGLLILEEVQLTGGKSILPVNIIKSARSRLGVDYAQEIESLKRERTQR